MAASSAQPAYQGVKTLQVNVTLYPLVMDAYLDKLARSSDPYLQTKLKKRVDELLSHGGQQYHYSLPVADLAALARVYGEQFVADPWSDIERYFDVLTGRFYTRPIPTQMAVLFFFGNGKPYKPNLGTLSAAGEAISGFCLERLGYFPLVRPIGIMPDVLMWTKRGNGVCLALCEAKASVDNRPERMLLDNVCDFMVDIKTRVDAFSRNHYEAYLTCCNFEDGGIVNAACLQLDLGAYRKMPTGGTGFTFHADVNLSVGQSEAPQVRLRSILQLQARALPARDEYLAGLLSEEATRTAVVAMLRERLPVQGLPDVDRYIFEQARDSGLQAEWHESQTIIRDTKEREDESLRAALRRYRRREVDSAE